MRFQARASSSAVHALPSPLPRPHHQQQFASLSFPVQATYLAAGSEEQQQLLTPQFQSVSQDSVVGQYRQHVSHICYARAMQDTWHCTAPDSSDGM